MNGKIMFCLLSAAVSCTLFASEISAKKIKTINQIVRWEYNKVASKTRAQKWQIYKDVNDPKIKAAIYAQIAKKAAPFDSSKTKLVGISPQARKNINLLISKRFAYKNAGEIAMGAVAEAERAYPLVKKGDDVTIRYYRGGVPAKVSGVVQSVRDGGKSYEVKNQLVRLSEIRASDRKYFDPDLNDSLRQEFINNFQTNLPQIRKAYEADLIAEELEKVTVNEKNGYIFFQRKWVTAKAVADELMKHYLKATKERIEVEGKHFVQGKGKAAPKKK